MKAYEREYVEGGIFLEIYLERGREIGTEPELLYEVLDFHQIEGQDELIWQEGFLWELYENLKADQGADRKEFKFDVRYKRDAKDLLEILKKPVNFPTEEHGKIVNDLREKIEKHIDQMVDPN